MYSEPAQFCLSITTVTDSIELNHISILGKPEQNIKFEVVKFDESHEYF